MIFPQNYSPTVNGKENNPWVILTAGQKWTRFKKQRSLE